MVIVQYEVQHTFTEHFNLELSLNKRIFCHAPLMMIQAHLNSTSITGKQGILDINKPSSSVSTYTSIESGMSSSPENCKKYHICDPICENPALRKSEKHVLQRILQRIVCLLQCFAKHCQRFPTLYQRSTQRYPDEPNAFPTVSTMLCQ